jgi:hypothetical protein
MHNPILYQRPLSFHTIPRNHLHSFIRRIDRNYGTDRKCVQMFQCRSLHLMQRRDTCTVKSYQIKSICRLIRLGILSFPLLPYLSKPPSLSLRKPSPQSPRRNSAVRKSVVPYFPCHSSHPASKHPSIQAFTHSATIGISSHTHKIQDSHHAPLPNVGL